jgi:hypothetical protein
MPPFADCGILVTANSWGGPASRGIGVVPVPAEAAAARIDVLESLRDTASARSLNLPATRHAPEVHRQLLAVARRRRMVLAFVGS